MIPYSAGYSVYHIIILQMLHMLNWYRLYRIAETVEKFEISNEMDEILIIKPGIFLDILDKFLY